MTDKKPTSFNNLGVAELRRSAAEDFAVPLEDGANKAMVLAALEESGVTWADYVAQHPEVAPDEPEVSPSGKQEHLTVPETTGNSDGPHLRFTADEPGKIVVAEEPTYKAQDKYLIKMVRENLVYESAGLRFTQEHPYALANADQADHILGKEDGFRQATPAELREYYS